jgi:3'-phosphoadenosine 5'-phosphosulfate sulfotransferase (PAPS reductase)/FAD synthetase
MLVDEYAIGAARLPTLRDVVEGERCGLESLSASRTPNFNYPFDITFFGFKAADATDHEITNHAILPQQFILGHTTMVAPLHEWSNKDVLTAIDEHGIPYQPRDDSVTMCQQCASSLSRWNGTTALSIFHKRFGFEQVH